MIDESRHSNYVAGNVDFEGRVEATGFIEIFRRHPVTWAIVIFALDVAIKESKQ